MARIVIDPVTRIEGHLRIEVEVNDHKVTAERKNVHVVVFNALVSGEDIVNEPRAHASNLVGADGRPHTASAKRYSAINFGGGYSSGQWDHVVGIIVAWARLKSPEVDDLIASFAEQIPDLLFQNEPAMV
jgi:hypothetical protein